MKHDNLENRYINGEEIDEQKINQNIEDFVSNHPSKNKATAYKAAFDEIFRILYEAKPFVDQYLNQRKENGTIKDEKQALKSIAGNSFSQAIVYIFIQNHVLFIKNIWVFI